MGSSFEAVEKTPGLIRGRSPLWLYSDLATQGELPYRGKRRPPWGVRGKSAKALAQQDFPCQQPLPYRLVQLEPVSTPME